MNRITKKIPVLIVSALFFFTPKQAIAATSEPPIQDDDIVSAQQQVRKDSESENGANKKQESKSTSSVVVKVEALDEEEKADDIEKSVEKRSWEDWFTPNQLTFISIFTVVVLAYQSNLLRKQVGLARREFIASRRPRLKVRSIILKPPIVGDPVKISYLIVNVGDTDAKLLERAQKIYFTVSDEPFVGIADYEEKEISRGETILANGKSISIEHEFGIWRTQPEIDECKRSEKRINLIGYLSYKDGNGTVRRTGFHRRWDVNLGRFDIMNDPDHEYDD